MKRPPPLLFEEVQVNGVELQGALRWLMIAAYLISPAVWLSFVISFWIKGDEEEQPWD